MGKVQDAAKKLLKAMYDEWIKVPLTYPKPDLEKAFAKLFDESRDYVRARMYLVEKRLITKIIPDGGGVPDYNINARGIDFIENNVDVGIIEYWHGWGEPS